MDAIKDKSTGVSVNGSRISNLKFAGDITLAEIKDNLQANLERI